jgi:hypothetical protein
MAAEVAEHPKDQLKAGTLAKVLTVKSLTPLSGILATGRS